MSLFQKSVLKESLKGQDSEAVIKAYKKFAKYFHNPAIQQNIRESKEEQFQQKFLIELFDKVFGYIIFPDEKSNLTTEFKNLKGAKKADGAILIDGKAIAVVELKGTKTKDLESIRQQAFDYKSNHPSCVYIITSNFEKLRFYIQSSDEHLEFNLFTLTEEQFKLMYLCLNKENIFSHIPLKIKEASVQEEEKITKKFYADYSLFKRELFRDLVKLNMKNKVFRAELNNEDTERANKNIKHNLFKKSQKLIDRFLFIFFAEDSTLLPSNSTKQILDKWKSDNDFGDVRPLYNLFKQYFNFLDTGRKGTESRAEIFAYNGGLFKPDAILDSLIIDNDLLFKYTDVLQGYDFESQVDVNILGHIFENSLNEIESVNAEIEGTDFDKQKTKRKKDGVFYTPKYITKYIVDNTVGKLCTEKKTELGIEEEEYLKNRKGRTTKKLKELQERLETYREWLLQLTICDPACGSGAFLNQALDFLIKEHQYIDELQTNLLGGGFVFPDIENTVLENNIFGVDLNEESVEIAKLSLWLRTAQPRRKLNDLSSNIKCGNSLIDSKTIAGDKAFKWEEEFAHIFKEKEKKAYHITTATHDSRTSQRMVDYKVRELRDNGTNPKAQPIWLAPEDEILITKTIAQIVKEDQLNVMAYNICGDHIHILLVCEEEEVSRIVQKIKAKTSRAVNINKGITITREHAPLSNKGEGQHAPLSDKSPLLDNIPLSNTRGEKQNSLWTQKFGNNPIKDEKQLWNTVEYIRNNRQKHELHSNKELKIIVDEMCCTYDYSFRTEKKGGFDVVIGNPPYVRQELVKEYSEDLKKYDVFSGKGDLYTYFYEKGCNILKDKGYLSFISSGKFFEASYGKPLVEFLVKNIVIEEVINFDDLEVFEGISAYPLIFSGRKEVSSKNYLFKHCFVPDYNFSSISEIVSNLPFKDIYIDDFKLFDYNFYDRKTANLISKLNTDSIYLKDLNSLPLVGVKTGFNDGFTVKDKWNYAKPYVFGKNLKKYQPPVSDTNIIFPYKREDNEYTLISATDLTQEKEHLENNRVKLESRAIIKDGIINGSKVWFEYQQINKRLDFDLEYIVYPNVSLGANFTISKGNVIDMTGFIIPSNDKLLLALLNSRVCEFVMSKLAITRRGGYQEYKVQYLEKVPLKNVSDIVRNDISGMTDERTKLTESHYNLKHTFQKYLHTQFQLGKLSRNLQNWYELEFGEFIKELNKAIKIVGGEKLTKMDEMEWMEVFETKKAEALTLKAEIDKTDSEIDQMVYGLYGLSEEEIKIVENS